MFQAICDPMDEVIIARPYWVSFPQQVKLAGGRPVFVDTNDHQLDIEKIEQAISPKTRAILINSPNNPTGAVYPMHELAKIAELALKHNLFIISDEAYSAYHYDGLRAESMFALEEIRPRLIVTRSFSKGFNMTGFRIGYVAAASEIIAALNKLQSHVTGNVCSFVQYGALAALETKDSELVGWREDLQRKRDFAFSKISRLFNCVRPQGAFYLFPDVSPHLGNGATSADLARRLLEETGVAVVPGEEFGTPGHIRISYAVSQDDLASGLAKITEAL
jgi:aspartate aminotransferase